MVPGVDAHRQSGRIGLDRRIGEFVFGHLGEFIGHIVGFGTVDAVENPFPEAVVALFERLEDGLGAKGRQLRPAAGADLLPLHILQFGDGFGEGEGAQRQGIEGKEFDLGIFLSEFGKLGIKIPHNAGGRLYILPPGGETSMISVIGKRPHSETKVA